MITVTTRDKGYDFIRFFAMFLIVIFHLVSTFKEYHFQLNHIVEFILYRGVLLGGDVGVVLFFTLSGAVLIKRYRGDEFSCKEFFYTRFLRIEIPQMIGFVWFCAMTYCVRPSWLVTNIFGFIISLLGLGYYGDPWRMVYSSYHHLLLIIPAF